MLYALGRYQRDAAASLRFSDVEEDLRRLLAHYGPDRRTSAAYPFHHLASDGVWEVRTDEGPGSPGTGVRELRARGAAGQLAPDLRAALAADPPLLGHLAHVLLDQHFPPSLHDDIAAAAGLDLTAADLAAPVPRLPAQRSAEMRERVLVAYEYRCAFCGFDGALNLVPVGLEAAHVRWRAYEGPDALSNGLCLCSLHHKLFDKGVLGLTGGGDAPLRIMVSQRFVGRGPAAVGQVLDLAGRPLVGPQPGSDPVAEEHVVWHTAEVFKGDARHAADRS
jgi:putative restriction endonuclease